MPLKTDQILNFTDPPRENAAQHGWFPRAEAQLTAIAGFSHGWDSNGAAPPSKTTVHGATSLLLSLCDDPTLRPPHIHPTRSGGVQLEWENGSRYFEIEVHGERAATYFYSDDSTSEETSGTIFDEENLAPLLFLSIAFSRNRSRFFGESHCGRRPSPR